MKVIKQGRKIKGTMRVTCKTCNAELEIMASDLTLEPEDRPCDPVVYSYVCPCCKRTNYLKHGSLTEEIIFDLDH